MPRKVFTAGEVLTAADTNTFLSDQVVMTFADSDARGSAIPTPVEGMLTYLADTNTYETFDGAAFVELIDPDTVINPMTTEGDLIYGGTAGVAERIELGSAGLVLTSDGTAPVWSAPAGGGPSYQLANAGGTTLTGASTITVSGLGDFTSLKIVVELAQFTATGQSCELRINGATTDYKLNSVEFSFPGTFNNNNFVSKFVTNRIFLGRTTNVDSQPMNAACVINATQAGSIKEISFTGGGGLALAGKIITFGGGVWDNTDAVTSISIVTAGTFSSGTIFVYGA